MINPVDWIYAIILLGVIMENIEEDNANNIIFLDFDGVINDNISDICNESIEKLKYIIDKHNAKVVVISSWLGNGTESIKKRIMKFLNNFNISEIDFIDPNFEGQLCDLKISDRLLGIVDYLRKHRHCKYVILDDDYYNEYKLLKLNNYRTHKWKGLQLKDCNKIKFRENNHNCIDYVNYHYRMQGDYEMVTNDLIKVLKLVKDKK